MCTLIFLLFRIGLTCLTHQMTSMHHESQHTYQKMRLGQLLGLAWICFAAGRIAQGSCELDEIPPI